jgi:phage host-nuclease inhibitor protein Gam
MAQISAFEQEKGTRDAINTALSKLAAEIQEIDSRIERTDAYSRLIGLGCDYLETHKPTTCPLCNQTIDPPESVAHLRREMEKGEETGEVAKLKEKAKHLRLERESYESSLRRLEDLETALEGTSKQIDDSIHRLMARFGKLGTTSSTILELEIKSLSKEIAQLDAETSRLTDEATTREQQLASFNQINHEIERLTREARAYVAAPREGRELLTALDRKIRE